jgi:hypothetical protein
MWDIQGKTIDVGRFSPFDPDEILYEFDGPRIFTLRDCDGELNLAYWSDEDESGTRYVVVPTSVKILERLRQGVLSVFDALNQPRCWVCDVSMDGSPSGCSLVDFEAIPSDALPAQGTMIWPSLEPLLTLRAVGDEIVPGAKQEKLIGWLVEASQNPNNSIGCEAAIRKALESPDPRP